MSRFKPDMEECKERLKAWWNHEQADRPIIGWYLPRPDRPLTGYFDHWHMARQWDDMEGFLRDFERKASNLEFGGEILPNMFVNYGPGIMASVFGCPAYFQSDTVWFEQVTPIQEIVPKLEAVHLNQNNEWYARLCRVTEIAAKYAKKDFSVSLTDLGGILDILSSFLTPKGLILALKQHPNIVDTCRAIILDKWMKVYDDLQKIIERYGEGCNSWLNVWCPKRWYPIQSDFAYMLSPKWFRRFVLPDIIYQAQHFDHSIYHLDGPNQFPYLEDLLQIPELDGIQFVPGSHEKPNGDPKWWPYYHKILDRRKNLVIDVASDNISKMYRELNNDKGLFCHTYFVAKIAAEFYLPAFIGGQEGIDED